MNYKEKHEELINDVSTAVEHAMVSITHCDPEVRQNGFVFTLISLMGEEEFLAAFREEIDKGEFNFGNFEGYAEQERSWASGCLSRGDEAYSPKDDIESLFNEEGKRRLVLKERFMEFLEQMKIKGSWKERELSNQELKDSYCRPI